MSKLRIGWIGLGRHTELIMYHTLRNLPVEVTAVCDNDKDKLDKFTNKYRVASQYTDYTKMKNEQKLDAVVCMVNPQVHYEVAKCFIESGVNVFIEKTPCLTLEQAYELKKLQEKTGKFIMTGFNRRFATSYTMAKEITQRKEFGKPTMYLAKYNASEYGNEENYITNHIINHLDLARYMMGEIKSLHVDKVKVSTPCFGYHISFVTESGAIGFIQTGSLQHIAYPMERVEISGVGSNVIIDNVKNLEYNRPPTDKNDYTNAKLIDGHDTLAWNLNLNWINENNFLGYEDEMKHFVTSCLNKTVPEPNFKDTVHTMELLFNVKDKLKALG